MKRVIDEKESRKYFIKQGHNNIPGYRTIETHLVSKYVKELPTFNAEIAKVLTLVKDRIVNNFDYDDRTINYLTMMIEELEEEHD